jgi:hypothetical protein
MAAIPRLTPSRAGDQVKYWFYSAVVDADHNQERVTYQFHWYETTGRTWSRFYCLMVELPEGRIRAYFAAPPISEADAQVIRYLMDRARRILSIN